ncbi:MAG: mannose-6-phosphate isomerase, class I [Lewinellaceae bacterium]|nr:mannose-6-phosphate isomerase, class I [Lewinellaceae bacterium]
MNWQQVFLLEGKVQHYDWGGYEYLPQLLGLANQAQQPYAELWMGTHPRGESMAWKNDHPIPLSELLESRPDWLGEGVVAQFGPKLPYLFKVLDVRQMLSIQVHPNKAQAESGFLRENQAGVSLSASHRNFKDDNHKPEVMVALTAFWLLHGFRHESEIARLIEEVPEFGPLKPYFARKDIFELYKGVMEMPQAGVDAILEPLDNRLRPLAEGGALRKEQPEFWAARAFEQLMPEGKAYDRGVFSIFLLNLVRLQPGQGIFQGAGVPHAYLEGVNVELMANSDNVFRGGLTTKHIDVPALLAHLNFEAVTPRILEGERLSAAEWAYYTPAPDFQLNKIRLSAGEFYQARVSDGPEILIVIEGAVNPVGCQAFTRGQAFFVPAGHVYALHGMEDSLIFKALVPSLH